jgi:glycosyltransferase involved in cell wall biosynthesis
MNWIDAALESVLDQTRPFDRVVIVDDGSNDGTRGAIDAFIAQRGPRIHSIACQVDVLDSPRLGPQGALNMGLELALARGADYVSLMSGDDVAHRDRLERQLVVLSETSADAVFSRPLLIDTDGNQLRDEVAPPFFVGISEKSLYIQLLERNILCAPTATIRAGALPPAPVFREDLLQLQDYELWLRMLRAGASFVVDGVRTTSYRIHDGQLSNVRNWEGRSRLNREIMSIHGNELIGLRQSNLDPRDVRVATNYFESELRSAGSVTIVDGPTAKNSLMYGHRAALGRNEAPSFSDGDR